MREVAHPGVTQRSALLRLLCVSTFLAPCCIVLIATWPGLYTVDSFKQLRQALTGSFSDNHPPIIAGLWSVLIRATGEPGSLLIFQVSLLAIGLLIWMRYLLRISLAAICLFLTAVAWNPTVSGWAGVLGKDSHMAFALLGGFAAAALLAAGSRRTWALSSVILLLATYAVGTRWNALAPVLPLFYLCLLQLVKVAGWRRHAIAATLTLILSIAAGLINLALAYGLLKAERDHISQFLLLHDLAGIQARTGQDVIPLEFRNTTFSSQNLIASYSPANADFLFVTPRYLATAGKVTVDNVEQLFGKQASGDGPLVIRHDALSLLALRQAWLRAIRAHPWAYVRHRISVLVALVWNTRTSYYLIEPALKPGDKELPSAGVFAQLLSVYHAVAAVTPIFSGWFLVLLHLLALAGCLLTSTIMRASILALVCSGLANVASFAVVGIGADFRYLLWTSVSAFTAIALTLSAMILPWKANAAMPGP